MSATYIAVDTETGGIGSDVSLLTAYIAVLDKQMNIIDELDSMKESMMEYPADLRLRVLAVLKKTGRQ